MLNLLCFFFYSNLQLIIFQTFFFFSKEVDWKSGYMGQWTSQPIPYPKAAIIIYVSVSYPRYGYLSSIFSGWEISVIFFYSLSATAVQKTWQMNLGSEKSVLNPS